MGAWIAIHEDERLRNRDLWFLRNRHGICRNCEQIDVPVAQCVNLENGDEADLCIVCWATMNSLEPWPSSP